MTTPDTRRLFADRGLRCTKQRLEIYRALAANRCHPTAEQLHHLVHQSSPGISLATVYNTLEALCAAGLCQKLATTGSSGARYDADVSDHLHVVTCDGEILDVPGDLTQELLQALPSDVLQRIEDRMGVCLRGVSISLTGEPVAPSA
ncbi:MAG: Fur family transcriptional regulator [Planctomycetota bacterium]